MSGSGNDFFSFPTIHVFFNATKQKRLVSKKVRESTKRSALVLRTIQLPRLNSDDTSTSSRVGYRMRLNEKKVALFFSPAVKVFSRKDSILRHAHHISPHRTTDVVNFHKRGKGERSGAIVISFVCSRLKTRSRRVLKGSFGIFARFFSHTPNWETLI